jgi:hypothetical protein
MNRYIIAHYEAKTQELTQYTSTAVSPEESLKFLGKLPEGDVVACYSAGRVAVLFTKEKDLTPKHEVLS